MDFSLFYFAYHGAGGTRRMPYNLLLEGARFADRHGFTAVWTPERHFHPFGGIYPNPALTGAALAAITDRVEIRSGSVVGPLPDPIRIAEEWAVVDNLSDGRVALSFAPGWPSTDFVLAPEDYSQRREVLMRTIDTVRRLWCQEAFELADATAEPATIRIYPAPVQPEVPVWLTSAGSPDTFRAAGQLGAGLLTHLLCQNLEELAKKITVYREAYTGTEAPRVAVMLPTFLGQDRGVVRETVGVPFLRTQAGLLLRAPADVLPGVDPDDLDPDDLEFVVEQAFDRYFETGGLFGQVEVAARLLDRLAEIDVDEVACMIDLDVEASAVLASLGYLATLKDVWQTS
ncbi:MupA/Atu3671 family FMN-dependent luciferase-like monooxygenase [Actinocrispum wychmicini]|uniref:Natural product biosynthesis luciferase-like monooxygenase protein n=1 Tax=Actinocrispum wychmicini TaxID=1213861 RepID=A0A4R2JJP3_9PSEU|nr:MupA/Atu3671 family FMN-dependent luciferase-like monooxygenase [Actinocrispum wychmicini]TCO59354.1 natural product biosynthesis luciferase-like monooxygenase protein [Actinocrispum wychmicini]